MIDSTFLEYGNIVFVVKEENNAFKKQLIKMTDSNGIEWFRYALDHWDYSIIEIAYCGKVIFNEYGLVRFNEDRRTELHFKYPDGQIYSTFEDDIEFIDEWFHTREEAEAYIEQLKQERI